MAMYRNPYAIPKSKYASNMLWPPINGFAGFCVAP
jgi:hypothetical protein